MNYCIIIIVSKIVIILRPERELFRSATELLHNGGPGIMGSIVTLFHAKLTYSVRSEIKRNFYKLRYNAK